MKATLEFNLPEESQEHLHAVRATDWYLFAWRFHQYLWKLNHDGDHPEIMPKIMEEFDEIIQDLNLTLD
jgi:hypothetical protein